LGVWFIPESREDTDRIKKPLGEEPPPPFFCGRVSVALPRPPIPYKKDLLLLCRAILSLIYRVNYGFNLGLKTSEVDLPVSEHLPCPQWIKKISNYKKKKRQPYYFIFHNIMRKQLI
jgi:hypothetical protein